MAQQLDLDFDVVRARVNAMEQLLDRLQGLRGTLGQARGRQGPGKWSSIPACTEFAQTYAQRLSVLDHNLGALAGRLATAATNLRLSERAHRNLEDDVEARLIALAHRATEVAVTESTTSSPECTPYDVPADRVEEYVDPALLQAGAETTDGVTSAVPAAGETGSGFGR